MFRTTLLFLAGAAALPLAAQDSVSAVVDLGFVNTAGNTDVTTLNVGEKMGYYAGPWTLTQRFSIVYARTAGTTTTNQLRAGARVDRPLANPLGLFALGAYERNTFAGIERRFEEALGITARLVQQDDLTISTEFGASLNQQTPVGGPTATFAAARAAADIKRSLTTTAYITADGEFLPNLKTSEDYRINASAALVAPISSKIATKLSYALVYDHLPEPGFKTTDRVFTAGLQLTF